MNEQDHNEILAIRIQLGKIIKQRRRNMKINQTELGKRAGISYKHVGDIERGQTNVTIETIGKIAIALNWKISFEPIQFTFENGYKIIEIVENALDEIIKNAHSGQNNLLTFTRSLYTYPQYKTIKEPTTLQEKPSLESKSKE